MKSLQLLAAAFFVLAAPGRAATPAPAALLDEAITKVKAMSYRSKAIDWPVLEARVRAKAVGATDVVDLLPALETLVEGLGDGHSFVNATEEDRAAFKSRTGHDFTEGRPSKKPTSPFMARRDPSVKSVKLRSGKSAGIVVVPLHAGGGSKATAYAQTLYDGLAEGASTRCGYVVDLRGNGGGNVWPMLTGLSPLLGEPWDTHDLKPDGTLRTYASIARGKATIVDKTDENVGATIIELARWKPLPSLVRKPVAVLTDDAVGSSGEGVTLAFKGRPRSRSFGATTYGVASSNEGFMLADRVNIVVTTGLMIDRFKRTYPDGIAPDVHVANPARSDSAVDPVMDAASRWLASQPGCSVKR